MSNLDSLTHIEQALLCCLMRHNECFDEINLKASDFFHESHRIIYSAISKLLSEGKPVDYILIAEVLSHTGELEKVGDIPYLGRIIESVSTVANSPFYAQTIREAAKLRKLKEFVGTLDLAIEQGKPVEMITELAESGFARLDDSEDEETLALIGDSVIEAIEWEDSDHETVKSGLRDLDQMTGGFAKSNLIILAARPSMGKTSLACQIAENVAKNEQVIFFSLEMSRRQISNRFLNYHENQVGKSLAVAHMKTLNFRTYEKSAVTLSYIRSKCRKIKRKYGLSLIVVDYLQLMAGEDDHHYENRNQVIGSITRGLKAIAKEFDIPVIALSQLSRKVEERADKRPIMSDLRESGEIEQDADQILFIYREEVYKPDTEFPGLAEILCSKNRNGPTGSITAQFDGPTTHFYDNNSQKIIDFRRKRYEKSFDE